MSYAAMPLADWQSILDAVRAKTGKTSALVSGEVSAEIAGINGGFLKSGTLHSFVATAIQSDDWIGAKNILVCAQASPLNSHGTIVGVRVLDGEVLDASAISEGVGIYNYGGSASFNQNTGTISINNSSAHFGAEDEPTFYNYVVC